MHIFIFLLFIFAEPLSAEVAALYLTWEKDPTSTMCIQWLTPLSDTETKVTYQKMDGNDEKECEASCQPLPDEAPYNIHVARIDQLEPDTVYTFQLPNDPKKHRFRTMPKDLSSPISFAVGGDVCPDEFAPFEAMCQKVALDNPRFVIFGGDLAYSVGPKRQAKDNFGRWLPFLQSWSRAMVNKDGCIIPLLVCIGNHEVLGYFGKTPSDAKFFYALFASPGKQGYAKISFANYLTLYLLDSGHTHPIGGEQTEWLKEALASSQKSLHRFAIYHVPAYPSVRYFRLHENSSIRRHWVPLFEKYGLNAAFENHDHAYKRTFPLKDGLPDRFGVVYFGDGSWGAKPRIPKRAKRTTYLAKTKSKRQYLFVTLTQKERLFQSKTIHDHIIDSYTQKVGEPSSLER